jgi:AcrR family transcriptional regulator
VPTEFIEPIPRADVFKGRREQTKAQNRQLILDAARNVFAELGYGAATVRDIIRATPLASGTFYNYFKSKEEVFQAIQDESALRIRPRLHEQREIERDGSAIENRKHQAEAETDARADCTYLEFRLNGADVGKEHAAQVVAVEREAELGGAGDGKIAADGIIIRPGARADPAETEATNSPEAAGVKTLEERRGAPDPAGVGMKAQNGFAIE